MTAVLSDKVIEEVETFSRMIAKLGLVNDVGLVMDEIKAYREFAEGTSFYYSSLNTHGSSSITMRATNGDGALEVLAWLRKRGWKSQKFTDDGEAKERTYELANENSDNKFALVMYFSGGSCEFVPIPGKRKHIKGAEAVKGKYVPIMELKCDGVALPTE